MRLWLQSTALLAVLAGYSILLLLNQRLSVLQRSLAHQQLVNQAMSSLSNRSLSESELLALSQGGLALGPGVRIRMENSPATTAKADANALLDGFGAKASEGTWLSSTTDLVLQDGRRRRIRLDQDVSASLQQQWLGFWLLVVAAGISSLFTSALLRLVLNRGLSQPLTTFSATIANFPSPPRAEDRIDLTAQPEEIQPIAAAFNALQDRLQQAWEQQRSFVDGVAHELRTPITLISGHAQSLLRQHASTPLSPSLQLIHAEAERMTSLISDLLDLARQDSSRLKLLCQPLIADDLLLELYERMILKAGNRLHLDACNQSEGSPPMGLGDPDRIQQCLTALVDNALQYTPAGSPITLASSSSSDGGLVLHVRDQGSGVPAQERDHIFERFARGSAALQHDSRGSGIGLSVVKLLMEAMGGSIQVCDSPEGGADFQLHLQAVRPCDHPPST